MKILLLPGQGVINKDWIYSLSESLKGSFKEAIVIEYDHWKTGKEECDIELEINKVSEVTKDWDEYIVFAKSIGSIISILGFNTFRIKNNPSRVVIVGLPYSFLKTDNTGTVDALKKVTIKMEIYQKLKDPFGSYDDVKNVIDDISNPNISIDEYKCIEEPNNDHHYANLETIKKYVIGK